MAGLTVAYELARAGAPVVVLERESEPGGLARSYAYGDFVFDIGPHRFHTDVESVNYFINDILGPDQIEIKRCSGVYFRGKYHLWPLRLPVLFDLPPSVLLMGLRDLLAMRSREVRNFEDYIVNMYGKTLYNIFFRDYSEKFLGITPAETDAVWAKAGMERAIIDKRLKIHKLSNLILSTLIPKGAVTRFIYPPQGIAQFCEKLAVRVRGYGAEVRCGVEVDGLETAGDRIVGVAAGGDQVAASAVVWTAPLPLAASLLGAPRPDLTYLGLVLYNVELARKPPWPMDFQWCYYGQKDIVFNRVSAPTAFSPRLAPPGRGSLCVEVTRPPQHKALSAPEAIQDQVIADMMRVGLIRSDADVLAVHIERVREAYPVYRLGFQDAVEETKEKLARFKNLHLAGRTGLFWYNNMDHSIEQAQSLAAKLRAEAGRP